LAKKCNSFFKKIENLSQLKMKTFFTCQQDAQIPILLLSNDVNLVNKSTISSINARNFDSFTKNISNLVLEQTTTTKDTTKFVGCFDEHVSKLKNYPLIMNSSEPFKNFVHNTSECFQGKLKNYILELLCIFYEFEMKKCYDDLW
jgi:hypothetical protein